MRLAILGAIANQKKGGSSYTAKSVILDIADGYGSTDAIGVRSIDFYNGDSKVSFVSDFTTYETSQLASSYRSEYAFKTTLSKTGSFVSTSFLTGSTHITNQRLIIVADVFFDFTDIIINNMHHYGGDTNRGTKNVKINISTDSITDTTYNSAISNSTKIFDGQFDAHSEVDEADPQTLELI